MSVSKFNKRFSKWLDVAAPKENRLLLKETFIAQSGRKTLRLLSLGGNARQRANARRRVRELATKMRSVGPKLRDGERRKRISRPDILLYKYPPDLVRDTLAPNFRKKWLPMPKRLRTKSVRNIVLKDFSFKRNPSGTLDQLAELIMACTSAVEIRLHFVDMHCDDVAPYILLARLRRSLPPIFSGGMISHEVHEVIEAVGLKRALRMGKITGKLPKDTSVSAFQMLSRVPPGAFGDQEHQLRPQYKELIADMFCDTLNGWLADHELELTKTAEAKLVASFGEALDNAERHGNLEGEPGTGDWSVAGFSRLMEEPDGHAVLECSVAMVSVGTTISDSLETAGPDVRQKIEAYVHQHGRVFRDDVDKSHLRTVMALQDGITRVQEASLGQRGGVGLMQLVNTFGDLGDCDQEGSQSLVTFLSGRSCLRITNPYRRGEPPAASELRELWFNPTNTDKEPPDRNHVVTIDKSFPGTILSACFTIDPSYLSRQLANDDDDGPTAD